MCVKFSPRDLNSDPYPHTPHPTSTYTCGVAIAPRVCSGKKKKKILNVKKIYFHPMRKKLYDKILRGKPKK